MRLPDKPQVGFNSKKMVVPNPAVVEGIIYHISTLWLLMFPKQCSERRGYNQILYLGAPEVEIT